jgi:hypothetical protein
MHRAGNTQSNATNREYNYSDILSRTAVGGSQFRFRDFWRS